MRAPGSQVTLACLLTVSLLCCGSALGPSSLKEQGQSACVSEQGHSQ